MDKNTAVVAFVAIVCGVMALISLVSGPIGKAIGRWIESYGGGGGADQNRLRELEGRVAGLEQASQRIEELEERLDFAERLLTQRKGPERLPAGPE